MSEEHGQNMSDHSKIVVVECDGPYEWKPIDIDKLSPQHLKLLIKQRKQLRAHYERIGKTLKFIPGVDDAPDLR